MKGIIPIALISIFLLSTIAMAVDVPRPISIKVITSASGSNIDVIVKDMASGGIKNYKTNEYGEIILDASDFNTLSYSVRNGDQFQVSISTCSSSSACVQTKALQDFLYFEFDLRGIYTPPQDCPTCNACDSCCPIIDCPTLDCSKNCPDTTPYSECNSCCADCTEKDLVWWETTIIALVTAAICAGVGFKITRYGTKTHEHKNVSGYHSPDIMHKAQPHKKGEIFPKYASTKGSDGRYKYLGGG